MKSTIESNEESKIDVDPAIVMTILDEMITDEPSSAEEPGAFLHKEDSDECIMPSDFSITSDSNMLVIEESDSIIHSSRSLICKKAPVQRTELLGAKNLSRKSSAAEIQMKVSCLFRLALREKIFFLLVIIIDCPVFLMFMILSTSQAVLVSHFDISRLVYLNPSQPPILPWKIFRSLQEEHGYFVGPGDVYGGDYTIYRGGDPSNSHSTATIRVVRQRKVS